MSRWMTLGLPLALLTAAPVMAQQQGQQPQPQQQPQQQAEQQQQQAEQQKAQQKQGEKAQKQLTENMQEIHTTHQYEIQLANLAQDKAQRQEVQDYARTLLQDHRQADQQLADLARQMNAQLEPAELKRKQRRTISQLEKASGAEFDQKFLEEMKASHEKAINDVQKAQEKVDNQQFTNHTEQILPVLQRHHDRADALMQGQPAA